MAFSDVVSVSTATRPAAVASATQRSSASSDCTHSYCRSPGATSAGAAGAGVASPSRPHFDLMREVSVRNSICSRNATSFSGSGGLSSRSASVSSTGTSGFSVTSSRLTRASSAFSIRFCRRFGCLISSARSSSVSRSPYSLINCAAVFTPMPGTPGTLSTESPQSACTSITLSGATPNFSITSSGPICLPFIGSIISTPLPTSCIRSLSDETMVTFRPVAFACSA